MYTDALVGTIRLRLVATYKLHAGYLNEIYFVSMINFVCVGEENRRQHMQCMIGSDFNTQLDIGYVATC